MKIVSSDCYEQSKVQYKYLRNEYNPNKNFSFEYRLIFPKFDYRMKYLDEIELSSV